MIETVPMQVIARLHSDFTQKFGIPRQSGLVDELEATVVFEPEYRSPDALRGLEDFSHLWLIWQFSEAVRDKWSPTVRPPRLGGNARMGVFATRSPFRPNPIGLSCVRLAGVELMDGTPILDIKPYIPYADCRPEASGGFTGSGGGDTLAVDFPAALLERVPADKRAALTGVLSRDPRPPYQHDPERVYGLDFAGVNIRFTVDGDTLTVRAVERIPIVIHVVVDQIPRAEGHAVVSGDVGDGDALRLLRRGGQGPLPLRAVRLSQPPERHRRAAQYLLSHPVDSRTLYTGGGPNLC